MKDHFGSSLRFSVSDNVTIIFFTADQSWSLIPQNIFRPDEPLMQALIHV